MRITVILLVVVAFFMLVSQLWFNSSGRAISRFLKGTLVCRGTSIRVRLGSVSLILHDVELEEGVRQTECACGLGGYLPCDMDRMFVAELEMGLQALPLLRWLFQVARKLALTSTRPMSGLAWWQQGLSGLEAMQSGDGRAEAWGAACPVRLRLGGVRMQHRATATLAAWHDGAAQLEADALAHKGRYLAELARLLRVHEVRREGSGEGDASHVLEGEEEQQSKAARTLLRCMLVVVDELRLTYVDAALPGELRVDLGRMEVQQHGQSGLRGWAT